MCASSAQSRNLQVFFRTNYYSIERISHDVTASCRYFTCPPNTLVPSPPSNSTEPTLVTLHVAVTLVKIRGASVQTTVPIIVKGNRRRKRAN